MTVLTTYSEKIPQIVQISKPALYLCLFKSLRAISQCNIFFSQKNPCMKIAMCLVPFPYNNTRNVTMAAMPWQGDYECSSRPQSGQLVI